MFVRKVLRLCNAGLKHQFHTAGHLNFPENPIKRTLRILGNDFRSIKHQFTKDEPDLPKGIPSHVDVVVIGGGAVGSSIAYWLKEKSGQDGISVAVIERDQTYAKSSTVLSLGGLRQQFSLTENIQMSLFGAEFIRTLKSRFGPNADVYFTPNGYLMLASEQGAEQLLDNAKLQKELGAVNTILTKDELQLKFPWLNTSDLEVGCLGLEKEGWFDPWALLCILKREAVKSGTQYIQARAVDFTFTERLDFASPTEESTYEGLEDLIIELPSGELKSIKFAMCVIAAGADSGDIAKLARIGTGDGILSVPLPVERRKRFVYCLECQGDQMPGINTPLTIDYTGTYFRREGFGGMYLAGMSPEMHEEPSTDNLDVDHRFFDERIWPNLAHRVPAFNAVKVRNAWGGYYDNNSYDENGIVGGHPYYHNLFLATGFSGHGIQQAPAVGRAIAELILDGSFQTIDLTRLGFDRLIVDKPMIETCII